MATALTQVYPRLAGARDDSFTQLDPFIVGQDEIVTDSSVALADIDQYEVCVLTDTGVTPYVVATHTGDALRKLVVAQHAVASGGRINYYTKGKFNHNMMIWPATVNTYALRKSLVQGTMLQIGHVKPPSA